MRTALKIAVAYDLVCPECATTIPAPCGSLYWEANEIRSGEVITCPECNEKLKLPKT